MRLLLLPISLILSSHFQAVGATDCFWPDGTPTSSTNRALAPCNNDTAVSSCCLLGDACLSNNFCFSAGWGITYRGGCTDPNWGDSAACPAACNQSFAQAGAGLRPCPPNSAGQWLWWCGDTSQGRTCYEGDGTEFLPWPSGSVTLVLAGAKDSVNAVSSATAMHVASSSVSPNTTENRTSCDADGNKDDHKVSIAIGAGVGIPLMLLAVVLGYLFFREKKRNAELKQSWEARMMQYAGSCHQKYCHREKTAALEMPVPPLELAVGDMSSELEVGDAHEGYIKPQGQRVYGRPTHSRVI